MMRNSYTIYVGKPEGKRALERPESRGGDNISIQSTSSHHVSIKIRFFICIGLICLRIGTSGGFQWAYM
jgi:hypothetical protein